MINIFFLIFILWVGWLLLDGILTGEIWARGGSKDRFTRSLDMKSFAHKVDRKSDSTTYWFHVVFYVVAIGAILYFWLGK